MENEDPGNTIEKELLFDTEDRLVKIQMVDNVFEGLTIDMDMKLLLDEGLVTIEPF